MATRLKNILRFTAVAAGGSATQAHLLNINGTDVVPDRCEPFPAGSGFSAPTITATSVTVTNIGNAAADVDVLVEHWHSIERAFGSSNTTVLTPQPFLPGWGAGPALGATVIFPGANKAAEIQAAFDAGQDVQLLAGVYVIETSIILNGDTANHQGRKIKGYGLSTILRATFVGGADTATNAIFQILGTVDTTKLNSTLSTALFEAQSDFSVAAVVGGLAAGDWVLMHGNNSTLGLPFA